MTIPRRPDDDRDIEQRLEGSWQVAVARAERDLADRELVSLAARPRVRRSNVAVMGIAALVVLAIAFVAVWNGGQFLGTVAASPHPVESQVVTGSFAPTPAATANPAEAGIPILDAGQTFPPSVDGQRVVPVGPEADAAIAAATDDSPIYVSGWLVAGDPSWIRCSEASRGVSAPNGTIGSDCVGTLLRAGADGGPSLRILSTLAERPYLATPDPGRVQPVLVQVHVRDPRCDGPDCARMPVLDRVLMYGALRIAPGLLAATLPPGGISAEQAVEIARDQIQRYPPPAPGQLPLLRVVAGTSTWVDNVIDDRWVWVVHLLADEGYTEHVVSVDYLDGQPRGLGGGPIAANVAPTPVLDPGQPFPDTIEGQPVVPVGPEADARLAAATDDSPIYVSGWLLGGDRLNCDPGVAPPDPNGVSFDDCWASILLRATGDGGASLPVFSWDRRHLPGLDPIQQRPILLGVHTHDPACLVADCAPKPVFDRVVMYGAARIAPAIAGATQPSDGISMEAAVGAARQFLTDHPMGFGGDLELLSAAAGPAGVVDLGKAEDATWIWAVTFATADGHETYTVDVDYRTAEANRAHGGTLLPSE